MREGAGALSKMPPGKTKRTVGTVQAGSLGAVGAGRGGRVEGGASDPPRKRQRDTGCSSSAQGLSVPVLSPGPLVVPEIAKAKRRTRVQPEVSLCPFHAQTVKNLPAMQETRFSPWVGKIPWRRACPPTPVLLPGESHGQRSLEATVHRAARAGHSLVTKPPLINMHHK